MADKFLSSDPAFIVVALLLFAAATPLAHGTLLNAIKITGILYCSPTGNSPGPPIVGAVVKLNCSTALGNGNGSLTVGQSMTGANGAFVITLTNISNTLSLVPSILAGNLPCNAYVNLPLNQTLCPLLGNVTGVLSGVPTLLNTVLSSLLGVVANFVVSVFVKISD